MTKVVHLTTVHQPFDVRIFYKQAVTLAKAGFDVVLIACCDVENEIEKVRIKPLQESRNRWERMTLTLWQAYRSALEEDAHIYHFHDPELIIVGLLLKIHGRRVIYDVHEDVSKDIEDKSYLPGWSKPFIRLCLRLFEYLASFSFDQIVAATSAIERSFPRGKVSLIRNVPIINEFVLSNRIPFSQRPRNIIYMGGLAPFNGIEQMVRAMGELPVDANIRLLLAGEFSSTADQAKISALQGWTKVDYLGWVDRDEIATVFAKARAGLVVYQPTPNVIESEPNKFFEFLSAGLPIIASDLPHWRKFISQHECGIIVPPSDPKRIAAAILSLVNSPEKAEEMGCKGQKAVIEGYNWNLDGARLISIYRNLSHSKRYSVL